LEAANLAFFSTTVFEGTAKGVVIAIGDDTVVGKIAGQAIFNIKIIVNVVLTIGTDL
jgi:magnesium-transporting ATPase (P-type)